MNCTTIGCTNKTYTIYDLCIKHYGEQRTYLKDGSLNVCKVDDCNYPIRHKTWKLCSTHSARFRKYGDVNVVKQIKDGSTKLPEYPIWNMMLARCHNPNNHAYFRYGGRGIKVHPDWFKFRNFYNYMGKRPSKGHSLERKDNNKGYEPGNVVWATYHEQNINKRNNSKHPGVCYDKRRNKWVAQMVVNRVRVLGGRFDTLGEAIKARKEAENKYYPGIT